MIAKGFTHDDLDKGLKARAGFTEDLYVELYERRDVHILITLTFCLPCRFGGHIAPTLPVLEYLSSRLLEIFHLHTSSPSLPGLQPPDPPFACPTLRRQSSESLGRDDASQQAGGVDETSVSGRSQERSQSDGVSEGAGSVVEADEGADDGDYISDSSSASSSDWSATDDDEELQFTDFSPLVMGNEGEEGKQEDAGKICRDGKCKAWA